MDQKKVAMFVFNGDAMCFVHIVLNVLDMKEKGYDVRVVLEGGATRLVRDLDDENAKLHTQYVRLKESGLIDCVCRSCAYTMGTLDDAEEQGLPLCGDLKGHPSISRYIENGYEVLVF